MSTNIYLNPLSAKAIQQQGAEIFPNECCGFMYGREDENGDRFIESVVPVINDKDGDQRRRFEISPFDYMKAEQYALKNNTQLLGVYHSHPNHPAIASQYDLDQAMPYFSYVIISVLEGKPDAIKSWRLKEEERAFYEEQLSISKPVNN